MVAPGVAARSRETRAARRHGKQVARLLGSVAPRAAALPAEPSGGDLPWLTQLDEAHLRRFLQEYARAYEAALDSGRWSDVDDLLGEWLATAEALSDPELTRLLAEGAPADERVPVEYPT